MFSSFLDKMTEQQRTAIERLLDADATLLEMLSDPDIVGQSKWETKRALKD
jgi:hypothetical protein